MKNLSLLLLLFFTSNLLAQNEPVEWSDVYGIDDNKNYVQFYENGKIAIKGDTLIALKNLQKFIDQKVKAELQLFTVVIATIDFYSTTPEPYQNTPQGKQLQAALESIGYRKKEKK